MCKALSVSKSAYYNYKSKQQREEEHRELERLVLGVFRFHKRRYGTRRIVDELGDLDIKVGRRKVSSILSKYGLQAIQPKSFVPKTTQSPSGMLRSPNLLLDRPFPQDINMVWVGDITYLPMASKCWSYLASWLDLCSRHIVAWEGSDHMREDIVIDSFKKGVLKRRPGSNLIVHSDGGGQYGSKSFRRLLANTKSQQSMTRRDNHYDNAYAESLFSRLKAELIGTGRFSSLEDARKECFDYIEGYYNTIRKHSSLGYKSPLQFERELKRSK